MENETDRVINGYLSNVSIRLQHLPKDERTAILDNLRAHYYEALGARCKGKEPTHADIQAVMAEMDPPEAFGPEQEMICGAGRMPSVLWLTIIVLSISIIGKMIVLLARPDMARNPFTAIFGIAFGVVLLYGLLRMAKWAYWLVVVGVPLSCALAFLRDPAVGLGTTIVNMVILLPVLMSKDAFLGQPGFGRSVN